VQGEFTDEQIAGEDDSSLQVLVELIDPGGVSPLWEGELRPDTATAEVDVDLSGRGGRIAGLRFRILGGAGAARWQGLRTTTRRPRPADRWTRYGELAPPPSSGRLGRPDVFVIMLDAARADVFEASRGAELTPHVQALAAEGTWFSRAWAPSSWTGQSSPALLTGRFPNALGIEHWGSSLADGIATFPHVLREAGYQTSLWSQHVMYRSRPELLSAFDRFEEPLNPDPDDVEGDTRYPRTRHLLPALAEFVATDRPTFAMIHLISPHDPYLPPQPFGGSRSSWYRGEIPITGQLLNRFDAELAMADEAVRDEVRRAALAMYEETVQFADHQVGLLVQQLRELGRYDDALIIVLSDHGEAFYEHGHFLHTTHLYEEFVRVPLAIKWPRSFEGFAARVDVPVSLVDVAPTLVDGLGVGSEATLYQGRSLLSLVRGESTPDRVIYAYTSGQFDPERPSRPQHAVVWNDAKLIYDEAANRFSLYRLSDDPAETVDVFQSSPYLSGWLRQALVTFRRNNAGLLRSAGGPRADDLDAEMVRNLRALGYLR
jgi:arylsulfatase A-like enzyme